MIKKLTPSNKKVIQNILLVAAVAGMIGLFLRFVFAAIGVTSIPFFMSLPGRTGNSQGAPLHFLVALIHPLYPYMPYITAVGAASAFLYAFLFSDKEDKWVFVVVGLMLSLALIAGRYYVWL